LAEYRFQFESLNERLEEADGLSSAQVSTRYLFLNNYWSYLNLVNLTCRYHLNLPRRYLFNLLYSYLPRN